MQITRSLGLSALVLASLPLMAQQTPTSPSGAAAASGQTSDYAQMRPVSGELAARLDSKSAHVGQAIVLKTTQKTEIAGGIEVPKGSRLLGHVTAVQAYDKKKGQDASIAFQFDRAELKNGQSFAIHALVQSVSLPAAVQGQERTRGWGLTGPGPNGSAFAGRRESGTASAGTALAGHGLVGDAALTADANGGQMHPNFDDNATGIPDVMLRSDASGASAGIFSAEKKNFRLESETQMVVGIVRAGK